MVINLGVRMDSYMMFDSHINHLCKNAFSQLWNFSKLRTSLSLPEKLVHAFVSSRLDYCNGLLIGTPTRRSKSYNIFNQITPIRKALHLLPVEHRIV